MSFLKNKQQPEVHLGTYYLEEQRFLTRLVSCPSCPLSYAAIVHAQSDFPPRQTAVIT